MAKPRPRLRSHLARRAYLAWTRERGRLDCAIPAAARSPVPRADLDLERPVWVAALKNVPSRLSSPESRAECPMIMALSPRGAPAPDWPAIHRLAGALFQEASDSQGASTRLSLIESPPFGARGGEGEGLGPSLRSRSAWVVPAYSFPDGGLGRGLAIDLLFDERRARRRRSRAAPRSWDLLYGEAASALWAAGMSRPREARARFSPWWAALDAIAGALRASGAEPYLCEGFFAAHASAFDDAAAFEQIDQGMLDVARARWALLGHAASPASVPAPRARSI